MGVFFPVTFDPDGSIVCFVYIFCGGIGSETFGEFLTNRMVLASNNEERRLYTHDTVIQLIKLNEQELKTHCVIKFDKSVAVNRARRPNCLARICSARTFVQLLV